MPNTFNVWRGEQSGLHFAGFDRAKVRDGGFFFAFEKEAADGYARDGQSRNFLVSCARVLDLTSENLDVLQWVANWGNEFEWYDRYSGEPSDAYSFIASGSLFDYEGDWSARRWRALFQAAESQGYDGVITYDTLDRCIKPILVVFNDKQIKQNQTIIYGKEAQTRTPSSHC